MKFIKNLFSKRPPLGSNLILAHVTPNFEELGVSYSISYFSDIKNSPLKIKSLYQYLQQLEEEGLALKNSIQWELSWANVFLLLNDENHQGSLHLLNLPAISDIRPEITGSGSLDDKDFSVTVRHWVLSDGKLALPSERKGAVILLGNQIYLMKEDSWKCFTAIKHFHALKRSATSEDVNKICWAEIRKFAKRADAIMDVFLDKTIVVKPECLQLKLNKSEALNNSLIQISPEFEDQPANWTKTFDRYQSVQDQYHITSEGTLSIIKKR
jgi:hypothetical protein